MLYPQVSRKILGSQNACTNSQDDLLPLPHNLRRDRPFVLVVKLTDIPVDMIKIVVEGVCGYGDEYLKGGVYGVISSIHVAG